MRSSLRALAERATHRFVFRRRLPPPFRSKMYVSSEGGLRYLAPSLRALDPVLLRAAREQVASGDVVWDVGANLGLFSVAAAETASRVVAVEPDPWTASVLRRSVSRLDTPVDVVEAAVASSPGVADFNVARRNRSTSHLSGHGTSQAGGSRRVIRVPVTTLDEIAERFPMPDVIKIDVEGAEVGVLRGGDAVLGSAGRVLIEVAGDNAAEVGSILRAHGFRLFDLASPSTEVELPAYNTLAIRARA